MKFLSKTVQFASLIAVVAFSMVACNKSDDTDLFAVNNQLAQKWLLGNYVCLQFDSALMTTSIAEWNLQNGTDGKVGLFKQAKYGNGQEEFLSDSLTWGDIKIDESNLFYTVPIVLNGVSKDLIYRDGVIETDGYVTTKQVISTVDIAQSLSTIFANIDYEFNDTVPFLQFNFDTLPFLYWTTQVVEYTQAQIDEYKAFLETMKDTIAWFNENYPPSARNATSEIPDTVRFASKPQANGLYKGLIPVSELDTLISTDTINYGPSYIINSRLVLSRDDKKENVASYSYHITSWSDEYYLGPNEPSNVVEGVVDSLFVLDNAKWAISSFTNAKKFVVTAKGTQTVTVNGQTESGEAFVDFSLSQFDSKGSVVLDGNKYELKK